MKAQLKKIIRKLVLAACTAVIATAAMGQQDPMYTQFFSNQMVLNPAYAGSRDAISITALYRNQWTGFPGAPVTQTTSIHAPISKGGSGAGLTFQHDKVGITDNSFLSGAYAYRIDLGKARLAFGLNGELRLQQINWAKANPLESADPGIAYTNRSLFLPNLGAGVYLDGEHWFVGASIPRMLETELKYASPAQSPAHLAQLRRHLYVSGGLAIKLAEHVMLRPQVLVKQVAHAPVEVDLNLGVMLKDKLWTGITYRTDDSIDLFVQYSINSRLRLGYAFDYAFTPLGNYSAGSHELLLGLELGKHRNGFFHPRYF